MDENQANKIAKRKRFRSEFQTKGSDAGDEILEKFILPFAKEASEGSGINFNLDDVVLAFFAVHTREFYFARAVRDFRLPGKGFIKGNRPIYGVYPRRIKKGQKMLIAVDKKEGTARIEVGVTNSAGEREMQNFLLEKFEFETIKDWIEVMKK